MHSLVNSYANALGQLGASVRACLRPSTRQPGFLFFLFLPLASHIELLSLSLLFIISSLEDVFSLLNHSGYHGVVDRIIDVIRAKNVRHKGGNHALYLHLILLFEFDDIIEKLDEEIKSILIYLRH